MLKREFYRNIPILPIISHTVKQAHQQMKKIDEQADHPSYRHIGWSIHWPGPGCSKLGKGNPGFMRNLISDPKALRKSSVQIFLLAIWSLDFLKRTVKIFPKRLLNKEIKKPELKFNPGLGLIGLWKTGPRWTFLTERLTNRQKSVQTIRPNDRASSGTNFPQCRHTAFQ